MTKLSLDQWGPGGIGQAHVHKISHLKVGQWKLANKDTMIIENGPGLIPT